MFHSKFIEMNIGYYLVFEMSHTLRYKINEGLKKRELRYYK